MAVWLVQLLLFIFSLYILRHSYCQDYTSANLSTSWKNNSSSPIGSWTFIDGSNVRLLLMIKRGQNPNFGFGFFINGTTTKSFNLTVLKFPVSTVPSFNVSAYPPIVLWSANRDHPVREDSTLELTADGNLVLREADGALVWSTNTSGASVTQMILGYGGDLKLVNGSRVVKWQSADYPTDTWLPDQHVHPGQRLTSSVSVSNLSTGLFSLSITHAGIYAFTDSDNPQSYHTLLSFQGRPKASFNFGIGSLDYWRSYVTYTANGEDFQYIRLEPDGHIRAYQLVDGYKTTFVSEIVTADISNCTNSTECYNYGVCANSKVCGDYGICTDGQCKCPGGNYFRQLNAAQPGLGCIEVTPLSCQEMQLHYFLELENVSYFHFIPQFTKIQAEECKTACLQNCSCKAAIFRYQDSISVGDCSLLSKNFSLMETSTEVVGYNAFAYIKVQELAKKRKKSKYIQVLVISVLASLVFVTLIFVSWYFAAWRKKKSGKVQGRTNPESSIQKLDGLKNFSHENLESATKNLQHIHGKGGFETEFKGSLPNGMEIAVKCLGSDVQKRQTEFIAEVNTLGNIHHFNLVKLVGYRSEGFMIDHDGEHQEFQGSQRSMEVKSVLVYEYMSNGSLDKWIFDQTGAQILKWEDRRKIIVGIAEGLKYLHVHCNPKIIHCDIKPQNILLDKDLNAKISDFGLAKLIERDQGQASTRLKGTRGYIAPELFCGKNVSVGADVYSFGIVVLEIICARKNLSLPGTEFLIDAVKEKVEEKRLSDLVDKQADMQSYLEDAVRMMNIAICCLQPCSRRPCISKILTALEGSKDLEPITDCSFLTIAFRSEPELVTSESLTPVMASILSGPR